MECNLPMDLNKSDVPIFAKKSVPPACPATPGADDEAMEEDTVNTPCRKEESDITKTFSMYASNPSSPSSSLPDSSRETQPEIPISPGRQIDQESPMDHDGPQLEDPDLNTSTPEGNKKCRNISRAKKTALKFDRPPPDVDVLLANLAKQKEEFQLPQPPKIDRPSTTAFIPDRFSWTVFSNKTLP